MNVMIFAAGLGTRLKPLTDTMPKALVPVAGQPLLRHVFDKVAHAGEHPHIVVNVHHFAQQIKDYLAENRCFGLDISISDESNGLLETGGGIKKAAPLFKSFEPILIHNVDILSNVDLASFYAKGRDNEATLLVSNRESSRYLVFDDDDNLIGWKNVKTGEVRGNAEGRCYAFSGIHIFSPSLFRFFPEFPDRFSIIDFYLYICTRARIKCVVQSDLRLLDVGKLDSLAAAEEFVGNNCEG
ncbi:MAG: nucleotidyltransferase family protein [Prevotellaceae bacterium]|nr:nucleotidyltransferase family protein [Prevotellaceae bacterium]